jgi:hypothetical protein
MATMRVSHEHQALYADLAATWHEQLLRWAR